jgi:hypothetical protein
MRSGGSLVKNVAIRGDVFYGGEYFGADVGHLLDDVTTAETFQETVNDFNGQFAVLVDTTDSVYAAVDHIASIPLSLLCSTAEPRDDERFSS